MDNFINSIKKFDEIKLWREFMQKGIKIHLDKAMLVALVTLAWPTVIEQLLSTIVQYIDTAMVGQLGAEATATISLSSTYTWLLNSIMSSAGIGFLAYVARATGEKNEYKVRHAAGQAENGSPYPAPWKGC